ncbi:MAG: ROK family protein [Nocardioidaceae bacterium]
MARGRCVLALDVGGTTIKAGIADVTGAFVHRTRRDTRRAAGVQAVVENLTVVAEELSATAADLGYESVAAGVVVPGIVDEERGIAVDASNIGWRDVPLRMLLQDRLRLPVYLGHDVRAGALAEGRLGAARGRRSFAFLPIGTGIGGAWVIDGCPYSGAHYAAAEVGHIIVRPGGDRCVCGRVGCLETLASASAIARRFGALSGRDVAGAADVADLVTAGDPVAGRVWEDATEALADALLTVNTLLDPESIVLGGGLSHAGELLLGPLRQRLADLSSPFSFPALTHASLGDEAGCMGAALYALDLVVSS